MTENLTNIILLGEKGNGKSALGNQLLDIMHLKLVIILSLKQNLLLEKEEKKKMPIFL